LKKIAAQNPHLRDAAKVVNTMLDTLTTALAQGERNPRDGAKVAVPKKVIPAFSQGASPPFGG
jgi:nucleoid DNA-binding protein